MVTTLRSVNLTLPKPKSLSQRSTLLADSAKTPNGLSITAVHRVQHKEKGNRLHPGSLASDAFLILSSKVNLADSDVPQGSEPYFSCASPHTYHSCPSHLPFALLFLKLVATIAFGIYNSSHYKVRKSLHMTQKWKRTRKGVF